MTTSATACHHKASRIEQHDINMCIIIYMYSINIPVRSCVHSVCTYSCSFSWVESRSLLDKHAVSLIDERYERNHLRPNIHVYSCAWLPDHQKRAPWLMDLRIGSPSSTSHEHVWINPQAARVLPTYLYLTVVNSTTYLRLDYGVYPWWYTNTPMLLQPFVGRISRIPYRC